MTNPAFADIVLLLALPASGKSEVRRYMTYVDRSTRIEQFHIADTVQLDDYPYVELMRETDEALEELGTPRAFFKGNDDGFFHGQDWGVLVKLINDDYRVMSNPKAPTPSTDPLRLFDRLDAARRSVAAPEVFSGLSTDLRDRLAKKMRNKVTWVVEELFKNRPSSLDSKTVVIEFARGGAHGSTMPLSDPWGYQYSLAQLSPEILEKSAVLYVWVDPEESRRKNRARAVPNATNTVLFHAVPESVMLRDYGCDDIAYLMETSTVPNTITVTAHEKTYYLPIGRFDNRVDKTTFVRAQPEDWDRDKVEQLHGGLADGLGKMWSAYKAVHKIA